MSIIIEKVENASQLKHFINFQIELYKGVEQFVPPLIGFEKSTFNKKKNPAFDHCEAEYWLAKKDGKCVGRIAGIIHDAEAEKEQLARFGWIDFIEDYEVFKALIDTVAVWAKEKGVTGVHGPLGFSDLDFEGTLISGFDQIATQATIYNYPYYQGFFERYGFEKAVDWLEVRGEIPKEIPKRLQRTASIVSNRFKLNVKKVKNKKELLPYFEGVFKVLNRSYQGLYGYYELSPKQIDYYIDLYFGSVRKEYMCIIVNEEDQVVGFALSLPSFSKAFQKAKGHLFPFGFIHVLKALRSNDNLDLFLIAVDPDYQKLGANVLIFDQLFKTYRDKGVKTVATGPMLEDNFSVLTLWKDFKIADQEIRRRCFVKRFES